MDVEELQAMSKACDLCGELPPNPVPWCCDGAALAVRRSLQHEVKELRADPEIARAMLYDAYAHVAELEKT